MQNAKRFIRGAWGATKDVVTKFIEDGALTLSAALAYYTALSFAPLIILMLTLASQMGSEMQARLLSFLQEQMGDKAATTIDAILDASRAQPSVRTTAGLISVGMLLFSASGVFAQLQAALNQIWNVRAKPGGGIWAWVRKRVLSFGMLLAFAFVILVSLMATAILAGWIGQRDAGPTSIIMQVFNQVVSLAAFTFLFALIYKYLPDVKITWRDVWSGAAVTAVLFSLGKYAIAEYLGNSAVGSAYGAAGSLVALLVWVYYSGLILFLGAEITEVLAERRGSSIEPDEHAVRVKRTLIQPEDDADEPAAEPAAEPRLAAETPPAAAAPLVAEPAGDPAAEPAFELQEDPRPEPGPSPASPPDRDDRPDDDPVDRPRGVP